jgi:hypothetical protein
MRLPIGAWSSVQEIPRVPKILVVYHSRNGSTRRIAEEIADAFGADLEEIVAGAASEGVGGALRVGFGALLGTRPRIVDPVLRPADYDRLVVASPVWCRRPASPVRSYLRAKAGALPPVGLVCTSRWPGAGRALADMARLCGAPPLATLDLCAAEIAWRRYGSRLDVFLRDLQRLPAVAPLEPLGVPA